MQRRTIASQQPASRAARTLALSTLSSGTSQNSGSTHGRRASLPPIDNGRPSKFLCSQIPGTSVSLPVCGCVWGGGGTCVCAGQVVCVCVGGGVIMQHSVVWIGPAMIHVCTCVHFGWQHLTTCRYVCSLDAGWQRLRLRRPCPSPGPDAQQRRRRWQAHQAPA